MKVYKTCFIGIPLPSEYQKEFEILLNELGSISPSLELVPPEIPHITVHYLDDQPESALSVIAKEVESLISMLAGTQLTVGGFGFFGESDPMVLFLKVLYPEILINFNKKLAELLNRFFDDADALPFHPHISLGRMQTLQAREEFRKLTDKFKSRLSEINWTFPVTELVLYGIDSTNHTENHEKLITILVK